MVVGMASRRPAFDRSAAEELVLRARVTVKTFAARTRHKLYSKTLKDVVIVRWLTNRLRNMAPSYHRQALISIVLLGEEATDPGRVPW